MPRTKPHFKILTTARNHPKMPCYGDNDLFALWARLGVEAIERFADRTGDTFVLHENELAGIAGVRSRGKAIKLLTKLTQTSPVSFTRSGGTLRIHFRNLAIKHGFKHVNSALRSPNANTDPDPDPGTPSISPPRPRRSDKPAPRKPARDRTPFPDDGFTTEMKLELAESPTMKGRSPSELRQGVEWARNWSLAGGAKCDRANWVAVVRNAVVKGYGLDDNGRGEAKSSAYTPPPKNTAAFERILAGPQTPEDGSGDELPLGAPTGSEAG